MRKLCQSNKIVNFFKYTSSKYGTRLLRFDSCRPSLSNGLCFCTDSFGVRLNYQLPQMVKQCGKGIDFLHIKNTSRNKITNLLWFFNLAKALKQF